MKIAITGASGFLGRHLARSLLRDSHEVHGLSRTEKELDPAVRWSDWDGMAGQPPLDAFEDADAVVHLAGEPISQKWTREAKQRIRDTRIQSTRNLVSALSKMSRRPPVLVCGSAIGFYGAHGDEILDETAPMGSGFLADLCREWEAQADPAESLGIRVVKLRTGVVLGKDGGVLQKMLPAFKSGVGGRLGSGKQWMSWVHVNDLVGIIRHAIEKPVNGAVNGTAPNPVTNAEFTRQLASALHRPAGFPVPEIALKALFGDMAEILVTGQRVLPGVAEATGYQFAFPQLGPALRDVLA